VSETLLLKATALHFLSAGFAAPDTAKGLSAERAGQL
jgi:hypothetical protein